MWFHFWIENVCVIETLCVREEEKKEGTLGL